MLVGILPQGSVEIRDVRYKNRTKDEDYRRAKPITIVRDIAAEMQIPADAILSDRLEQPIVIARHRAVYEVARLRPDISITKIGQAFGRDHSTISNSLKVWPGIAAEYGYEAKPLTGRRATA
nr:helix-turn-helix domain-containing protein [Aurantimonas sp. CSK15Z-1]